MKKNYKSDFDIILTLKTCVRHEDGTCSKRDVGWPEHDWVATFRTESGLREYVASRKGDAEVERLIAERYSHGKEIEINREATTKPERFAEYLEYIEECKRRAKVMLATSNIETNNA